VGFTVACSLELHAGSSRSRIGDRMDNTALAV
jgi:hypothetical protein